MAARSFELSLELGLELSLERSLELGCSEPDFLERRRPPVFLRFQLNLSTNVASFGR